MYILFLQDSCTKHRSRGADYSRKDSPAGKWRRRFSEILEIAQDETPLAVGEAETIALAIDEKAYPTIIEEDIKAAVEYAAKIMKNEEAYEYAVP